MSVTLRSFRLSPARTLDILVAGKPSGETILLHHGTPSDATCWSDWDGIAEERGVRIVSISRPGYATSTRVPGRDIASCAADAEAVLNELDVDAFRTIGWSGGGPHALACAALLGDRCLSAATLAGVAPFGLDDLDFLDGMGPENISEFTTALEGEDALRRWMHENAESFRTVTRDDIVEAFGGLVPNVDKKALAEGYADHMATETRRALQHGFDGWIDDDIAFTKAWGFDVSSLNLPVTVWQGDLDLMVPRQHGGWLAEHIPSSNLRSPAGHGHISLVTQHRAEILDDLMTS